MSEIVAHVEEGDLQAVLEGYSFARIQWLQIALAVALAVLGYTLFRLYAIQSFEGMALMEDLPWLMPLLTFIHLGAAAVFYWRDRRFIHYQWQAGPIDPDLVAQTGWRSAPSRTPEEVCILLIEATMVLRLAAAAGLALVGLAVLWVGITTSDLLKQPLYWINAGSYFFWWYLWFRTFLTRGRAVQLFRKMLPAGASALEVSREAD